MINSIIVAVDQDRGIGFEGDIPWHLSDDLKNFKRLTMGHHLILGRKTFETIGRPLPGRKMVVITRNREYQAEDVEVVNSLPDALELARQRGEDEAFIAGGGQIYEAALPLAGRMYLTEVQTQARADTYFPDFDPSEWEEKENKHFSADAKNDHAFVIRILERKTPA